MKWSNSKARMRLYHESSWSLFSSYKQTTERERVGRWERRVHRDVHSARRWWTGRSPLWYEGRLNVGSAAAQNDLLISTASQWRIGQLHEGSPDTTPTRKEPERGWGRERVANPIASSDDPGRVVAYLILGNYGGTMKGANGRVLLSAAIAFACQRIIFLLIKKTLRVL